MEETNQTQAAGCTRSLYGCPIDPLAGSEIWYVQTGIGLRGAALTLTYDSVTGQRPISADNITSLVEPNAFGALWHSNFHHALQVSPTRKTALLTMGDARVFSFTGDGAGNFTASGFNNASLVASSGNYVFTDINSGGVEVFNAAGQLQSAARTDGATLNFTYTDGNLTSVTDGDGRAVVFVYANNLVTKIIGPDGQVTTAAYDANKNLSSLTWADGKTRGFVYEDASHPWALTGVVDENGDRHATFAYDAAGRVISEEFAGGVQMYTVSYTSGPTWLVTDSYDAATDTISRVHSWQAPVGTMVTTPNGHTLQVGAQTVLGMSLPSTVSQPAGSGNASAGTTRTYDANGNVTSLDDASGNRTCTVYDSRNRETVRVEGLASTVACNTVTGPTDSLPSGARRVSTTWHSDWKLPTQVTEPLRKTTYVYHGQPDPFNGNATANCATAAAMPNGKPLPVLCKQVEQGLLANANLDPEGSPSAVNLTYDSAGRILSTTDAKGRATTFQRYPADGWADGDPDFGKVALLLHADAPAGTKVIVDSSPRTQQIAVAGSAQIGAAQVKFGAGSLAFSAAGDYVAIPYTSDFNFSASDFTIEMYVYKNGNNTSASRLWSSNGDLYDAVNMGIDGSGNFGVYLSTNGTSWTHSLPVVANLANGHWYHLAVARAGGTVYAFVNGAAYTVTTTLGTTPLYINTASPHVIGGQGPSPYRILNGYIDDVRITVGKARYVAAFNLPSQAFDNNGPTMGHSKGDIHSITDAAGHVEQFTLYTPTRRIRQMVDVKGAITDITYAPRGWLSTVTVTPPGGEARTTTYSRDDVGQLIGVASPDQTTLLYQYDAAHRLVGVSDARGNSVRYTLDAEGNRIAEEVKDSTGVLRRSVARSFDALNRIQQVTGSAQ